MYPSGSLDKDVLSLDEAIDYSFCALAFRSLPVTGNSFSWRVGLASRFDTTRSQCHPQEAQCRDNCPP